MRLVRLNDLRPGMKLGRSLYNASGQVLLRQGLILRETLIESLKKQQYIGVYVDDDFSGNIDIEDVVDERLRADTVEKLKSLFVTLTEDAKTRTIAGSVRDLNGMISKIVDQVYNNRHVVVNLVDLKNYDDYTFQHSVNVAALSTVLGVALNYKRRQLIHLARGALFHDVGKMFVDLAILNKPGPLTIEEFAVIKEHPKRGYEYVKHALRFSAETLIGILQHHEKYDGTGYPEARRGDKTHPNAQIIAITDVFDAMTSIRTYHAPISPCEAIEYIMGNAGRHFNARIVDVFLRKIPAYPKGVSVFLSNGQTGLVAENFEGLTMRPKVKLYTAAGVEDCYIDLRDPKNAAITIVDYA